MTDSKLLGNFIENPCAFVPFRGAAPYVTHDIFLSSSFHGDVYVMDGTDKLKTSIAEIMAMIRAGEGVTHEQ